MIGTQGAAGSTPERFLVLDSLRGLSACVIVLHHCWPGGYVTDLALVRNAHPLVEFFFVLSGFVISASYGRRLAEGYSLRAYALLRWGRIYPLHLAILAAFLAVTAGLSAVQPNSGLSDQLGGAGLTSLAATALFLQVFAVGGFSYWNGPSWTIAAEFWIYLLAALALRVTRGRQGWLLPVLLALLAIYLLQTDRPMTNPMPGHAVLRCAYGFGFGALAWWVYANWARGTEMGRTHATLLELALGTAAVALVAIAGNSRLAIAGPPLFLLTIILFACERGAVSQVLVRPPFILLGTLSYSIYMIHALMILLVGVVTARLIGMPSSPLGYDVLALATLALVVLCANFSYRWIERPARDASRRLARRFDTTRAEAAAPTF